MIVGRCAPIAGALLVLVAACGAPPSPNPTPAATGASSTADPFTGLPGELYVVTLHPRPDAGLAVRVEIVSTGGVVRLAAAADDVRPPGWDEAAPMADTPALVGPTGRLVLNVEGGGGGGPDAEAGLIVDLTNAASPPVVVAKPFFQPVWGPDGSLVDTANGFDLIDLATGARTGIAAAPGIDARPAWLADGSGWVATRADPAGEIDAVGVLTREGVFRVGVGTEDPWTTARRTFGRGGGVLHEAGSDGPFQSEVAVVETRADLPGPCRCLVWVMRVEPGDGPAFGDYSWDAARTGIWVLRAAGDGPKRWLSHITTPEVDAPVVDLPAGGSWRIAALSPDDRWLVLEGTESRDVLVVDTVGRGVRVVRAVVGPEDRGPFFGGWVR